VTSSVRFEDEADEEYRAAARWYEERRRGLGAEFLDAVDAALSQIVRFPRAGAPVPRVPAALLVRRAPVKRFPYHVVYVEMGSTIRVLAVAHDRRRPRYWKSRV
jgi:toxin ParE1/3/4